MEISTKLFAGLLITLCVHLSSACNGYKARLTSIENCGGAKQVFKIDPNITLSLSKNCEIVVVGCAETIGFTTSSGKYTVLKNGNRITSGTVDMCKELQSNSGGIGTALMSFGLPGTCPVEKMRKCVNGEKKISIAKHKAMLPLCTGNIDISIDGTHDTGKTCLHAVINISRN